MLLDPYLDPRPDCYRWSLHESESPLSPPASPKGDDSMLADFIIPLSMLVSVGNLGEFWCWRRRGGWVHLESHTPVGAKLNLVASIDNFTVTSPPLRRMVNHNQDHYGVLLLK
jgi:hypothetical protein